jgi:hypothetical protein
LQPNVNWWLYSEPRVSRNTLKLKFRALGGSYVPKYANNCSTGNGTFGAIAEGNAAK